MASKVLSCYDVKNRIRFYDLLLRFVIKCNEFGTYVGEPCQRPNNNIKYLSIVDF